MAQLVLIDDDPGTLTTFGQILRMAGHTVFAAASGVQGLSLLEEQQPVDLVLSDLRLPDMPGIELLRHLRSRYPGVAVIVVTGWGSTQDVVAVMRLGAAHVLEKPVFEDELLRTVAEVLGTRQQKALIERAPLVEARLDREAHAAARWARAVLPVIDAPRDPRTVAGWGRLTFVSPGALRNWCRTAGVSPRRSLVFARLLRAVYSAHGGRHRPENLLDVVDRRTLVGLLKLAGFEPGADLPDDVETFLERQTLVCDPDALFEIRRALRLGRHAHGRPCPSHDDEERARPHASSSHHRLP